MTKHKGHHIAARALRRALLTACCIAALPGIAAAQDKSDDDEVTVIGSRTVTGTKTDAALTEIPQSVSIITSEEFQDRAAVDFQDIFRYSAGVQTERSGLDTRGDFFFSRGFETVQYLDGLNRMPSFVYGARMEVFTLERAEVLRGPSSTLYGAGGVGGLFNGVSKKPREEFGGEVGVVFGTQGRKEAQFDVTGSLTDGVSARLVALVRHGNLIHESQDDNRFLVMPSISFRPTPDTEITLLGLYQKDRLGTQTYVPITKTIGAVNAADRVDPHLFVGEPDFNHMDSDYKALSLLVTHNFGDVATFNSRSRIFGMETGYQEIYGNGTKGYADPATRRIIRRSVYLLDGNYDGYASDNNLALKFDTGPLEHQLLFGIDYTYFHARTGEAFPATPDYPLDAYNPVYGVNITTPPLTNFNEVKNTNFGFYAQEQIRAWDRVTLVAGVRRDRVTSRTVTTITTRAVNPTVASPPPNSAWTFRVGIIADLVEGVSPYFNYSESFLPRFGITFAGIPYVPQAGRQYEAGVKFEPMRGSLITVSLFDIKESNYISRDPNNIQNFIQGGSVGSKGVELEANMRLPGDTHLTASYSYTQAKVLTATSSAAAGARIANLPEHQATFWATKGFDLSNDIGLKVGGGVRYNSSKIDSFANFVTPDFTVADAMVELTYGEGWTFGINASNIFDTTIYTSCSRNPAAPEGYCYLSRDRTILASIRKKF
ncbi:TonB-dependent siderophore receptor [Sphingomonas sp. LT1P40]|uniref:TonB-dependent siderophore receptor n=1 Tax=Alteristakelama amylovorans TaxID=3096166 RepID=UPI002FC7CE73